MLRRRVGRPSVDPVVFFRLQLVMFFEGIRSERQFLRLAADRLSVQWFLGYNLDEPLPDHSSLTRIRARYGLEVFRRFFEAVVEHCQQAGLVWGQELYVDATQVQANASLDSLTPRFAVAARAAIRAHLAALFPEEDAQQERQEVAGGAPGAPAPRASAEAAPPPELTPLPAGLPESLREELAAANAARHDWIAQGGRQQRELTHGTYQRLADFRLSTTDPDATLMRLKGGGVHLGYQAHYVVDGGKRHIILGVVVTPGEVMENQPKLDLLWHAHFRWKLRPRQATRPTARWRTSARWKTGPSAPTCPCPTGGSSPPSSARSSFATIRIAMGMSAPMGRSCGWTPSVYRTREAVSGRCRHLQRLPAQGAVHHERARAPPDVPFR